MKIYKPSPQRKLNGQPYHDNPQRLPYDNEGNLKERSDDVPVRLL